MGEHESEFPRFNRLLWFILVFLAIIINVLADDQDGFLSIDCGRSGGDYVDGIGLNWVNDGTYIKTGMNSNFLGSPADSSVDNYIALQDFRFFPEPRQKHCYELPTWSNISYLVRAMFYNDLAQLGGNLTQFDVFVNSSKWFTLQYATYETYQVFEGIFFSPGNIMDVCLVPVYGTPFISSLELRPLDRENVMYSNNEGNINSLEGQYLSYLSRINPGAELNSPTVRFPDDKHDRLWHTPGPSLSYQSNYIGKSERTAPTGPVANNVPLKVMQDAWMYETPNSSTWFYSGQLDALNPFDHIYAANYFFELSDNASDKNVRGFNFNLNGPDANAGYFMNATNRIFMVFYYNQSISTGEFIFTFTSQPWSMLGPIVNAVEVYSQHRFNNSATAINDVHAVETLKKRFRLMDWQGDPCTPVPHGWLTCTAIKNKTRGDINLTFKVATISLEGVSSDDTFFDPMTTKGMDLLSSISIRHSNVDTPTLEYLIKGFVGANLVSLNLAHNIITTLPTHWGESNLISLDLSNNSIKDDISSIYGVFKRMPLIQELSLGTNNFTGTLSSDLTIMSYPNVRIIDLRQNNIQGVDLSTWVNSLTIEGSMPSNYTQLLSLLYNNISWVNGEDGLTRWIESTIRFNESLLSQLGEGIGLSSTTILLGGNSWCNGQTKASLARQYLCRFSSKEPFILDYVSKRRQKVDLVLVIGICVGAGFLVVLFSSLFLATLLKLSKQMKAMNEIQQALAEQKVHPPFFSFNDLSTATRDFHPDNLLGRGAFGAVYKGSLDGCELGVKRLFNSEQALSEFLNEVVLITGIKHRNLIQLRGCCVKENERILVYEYAENGNLAETLLKNDTNKGNTILLSWEERLNICVGIARGLCYLHEELQPCIVHRDIKLANILLDKNWNAKIADFGLARHFLEGQSRAQYTQLAGTIGYFAPEYATQGQLTEKADVYSFGILALEVVSGRRCIDYSLVSHDRVFLKEWASRLQRENKLLDLLQPELNGNCVDVEVIRMINISLLCVHADPLRRPMMSQVVTMLLGSMDVTVFIDRNFSMLPDFSILMEDRQGRQPGPNLHISDASTLHRRSENVFDEDLDETSPLVTSKQKGSQSDDPNTMDAMPTKEFQLAIR